MRAASGSPSRIRSMIPVKGSSSVLASDSIVRPEFGKKFGQFPREICISSGYFLLERSMKQDFCDGNRGFFANLAARSRLDDSKNFKPLSQFGNSIPA
jgi:hypothetical protein